MPRRPPQTIEALVLKMHRTRVQAETLRKQMAACECQREERQNGWPCWKATWIPPEYDNSMDAPRLAFRGYWDHAGGNAEEGEPRWAPWCDSCAKREKLRAPYAKAKRLLGTLKTMLWRAAKRLHDSAEREERR